MTTVREIMSTDLVTVEATTTVAEAATVMGARHVGSALVLDGEDLSGIFTERDIVRALSEHFDAPGHPVSQWMTTSPSTVEADVRVEQALDQMLQGGFRHLPVTEAGRLVGMVSIRDLSGAVTG